MGIIPEAMLNFLAFLGWNPGTDQEIFTLEELVHAFDLNQLQKSGAIFNIDKLFWFNREHLKRLSNQEFLKRLRNLGEVSESAAVLTPLLKERATTLRDAFELISSPEFAFVRDIPSYDSANLIPESRERAVAHSEVREHLRYCFSQFDAIAPTAFKRGETRAAIFPYAEKRGRGAVLWPLRYALSGSPKSPDPFTIAEILGKEETLRRLSAAIEKL